MKLAVRNTGLVLMALAIVATACSKSSTTSTSSPSSTGSSASSSAPASGAALTIDGKTATNKGTQDLTGKTTFDLNLDNDSGQFYFEPTILKGAPGQKVTLTLKNVGNTKHNFTLDAQQINQDVNTPGASATVTVTFPQTGSLPFHCEYHQSVGMSGELSVSP
jgi:plastocyanin